MDNIELMRKVDEITAGINVYDTNIFANWIAKEVVEAIEYKEDSISIERLLLAFELTIFRKAGDF